MEIERIKKEWIQYYEWYEWSKRGFDNKELDQWLKVGFDLSCFDAALKWKRFGFVPKQAQEWISIGLDRGDYDSKGDADFAYYLQKKGYEVHQITNNLTDLRNEYLIADNYLEFNYSYISREKIKWLNVSEKKLVGLLDLKGFENLEKLNCRDNHLTDLDLSDCKGLIEIFVNGNELTNLNCLTSLPCPEKITYLDFAENNLKCDLSPLVSFVNCKTLFLYENELFGSLFWLRKMTDLKEFRIDSNHFISSGLEYLPDGLKDIICANSLLENQLMNYWEGGIYDGIEGWRKDNQELVDETQKVVVLEKYLENKLKELQNLLKNLKSAFKEPIIREDDLSGLKEEVNYPPLIEVGASNNSK